MTDENIRGARPDAIGEAISVGQDGSGSPILLFDGTCVLCNGAVRFVLEHERDHEVRFATLESRAAAELLARAPGGDALRGVDSLVFVEGGEPAIYSTGALRLARHLRWPWRWAYAFVIVPRPIRDAFYRWFARHRYRWFGRTETCLVPTPETRGRFLEG